MLFPYRLISIIFVGFLLALPAQAQFFDSSSAAQLVTDPEFPGPLETVTISLEAYTVNTTGATIEWYVDGVELIEFRNERNIILTTGKLGEKDVVTAKITRINSFPLTATRTIEPTEVSIVFEAATYVPAFYQGRALPSSNSKVRVIAIPHTTPAAAPSTYTYEWKQSGTVLFGGPVKGKYAAEVTMSRYEGDYITVIVSNASGRIVGGKSISLTPADPELHFYEENPLRGLSNRALGNSLTLIGDETTIHGEPYYMSTDLSKKSATFDWSINGAPAATDSADQHTITLRRTGGAGSGTITLNAITTDVIPQYTQGGFSIVF